jgi:hypothetical protein
MEDDWDDVWPAGAALEAAWADLLANLPANVPARLRSILERAEWTNAAQLLIDHAITPEIFAAIDPSAAEPERNANKLADPLRHVAAAGVAAGFTVLISQMVAGAGKGGRASGVVRRAKKAERNAAIRTEWLKTSPDLRPSERARMVRRELKEKAKQHGWYLPDARQIARIGARK